MVKCWLRVFQDALRKLNGEKFNFIIVSSVAGGTGGGMFVDIPGIIKSLRENNPEAQSDQYYGFLLLDDVVNELFGIKDKNDKVRIPKNAVSILTELDLINLYHQSKHTKLNIGVLPNKFYPCPYNLVILTSLKNEKINRMDEQEDYFELMSSGAHLFHLLRSNWPGIENALTKIAENNFTYYEFPINSGKGKKNTIYPIPIEFPRNYGSFGAVILEIDDEEIKNYVKGVIAKQVYNILVEETANTQKKIRIEDYTRILNEYKESEGNDKLIKVADRIIEETALATKRNILTNVNRKSFEDKLTTNLLASKDINKTVNGYLADIDRVLEDDRFFKKYRDQLDEKNKEYNESLQKALSDKNLTIINKMFISEEIVKNIKYELNDLRGNEALWIESMALEDITDRLTKAVNSFKEYRPGKWSLLMNKDNVRNDKKNYAQNIAKLIVYDYFNHKLFSRIIPEVQSFYNEILKVTDQKKNDFLKEINNLKNFAETRPEFHGRLQPSTGGVNFIDFKVKIANTRTILDKYVIKEDFFQQQVIDGKIPVDEIKAIQTSKDLEEYSLIQSEKFLSNTLTLDNALKWEAKFFLYDFKFDVFLEDKSLIECKGLADLYMKAKKTKGLFDYFINDTAKKYFDVKEISTNNFKNLICQEVITEASENIIIESLVIARIKAVLQHLHYPFNKRIDETIKKMKTTRTGESIIISNQNVFKTHSDNAFLRKIIAEKISFDGEVIKPRNPNEADVLESKSKAEFYILSLGFPLQASESIFVHEKIEKSRIASNLNYFTKKHYTDNNHADKRFSEKPQFLSYSPLLCFVKEQDEIINPWKLILLLIAQNSITIKETTNEVQINKDIRSDITFINKEVVFEDMKTLFRFFLVIGDSNVEDLIISNQKSLEESGEIAKKLQEAFDIFKDKQYAETLNSVLEEFVESFSE
jgi:hypothetical protein